MRWLALLLLISCGPGGPDNTGTGGQGGAGGTCKPKYACSGGVSGDIARTWSIDGCGSDACVYSQPGANIQVLAMRDSLGLRYFAQFSTTLTSGAATNKDTLTVSIIGPDGTFTTGDNYGAGKVTFSSLSPGSTVTVDYSGAVRSGTTSKSVVFHMVAPLVQ